MNPNKNFDRNFCEWFMVEVAGVEPASPNIKIKASTCLSQSLFSPPDLQWAESLESILSSSRPDR